MISQASCHIANILQAKITTRIRDEVWKVNEYTINTVRFIVNAMKERNDKQKWKSSIFYPFMHSEHIIAQLCCVLCYNFFCLCCLSAVFKVDTSYGILLGCKATTLGLAQKNETEWKNKNLIRNKNIWMHKRSKLFQNSLVCLHSFSIPRND